MTTTLFDGTELAAVELPDGVTGFGAAEVAYLLSRHDGPAIRKSAELLRVTDERMTEFVRACGASSLLARGLAAVREDDIESLSAAALLEYGALRAGQWTVVKRIDGPVHDGLVIFHTAETLVVAQPRSIGTLFVSYSGDLDRPADLVLALIGELISGDLAAEVSVSTSWLDTEAPALLLQREAAPDRWRATVDGREAEPLDEEGLRVRIADLLALPAPPPDAPQPVAPRDPEEQARIASKFQDRLG